MDVRILFGQNVERRRVEKNLTQAQLAKLLHVRTATIANLEQGIIGKRFGVKYIIYLAQIFGCREGDLFTPYQPQ